MLPSYQISVKMADNDNIAEPNQEQQVQDQPPVAAPVAVVLPAQAVMPIPLVINIPGAIPIPIVIQVPAMMPAPIFIQIQDMALPQNQVQDQQQVGVPVA